MSGAPESVDPPAPGLQHHWSALLRLRWLLGGVIALAFAFGQAIESVLLGDRRPWEHVLLDVVLWGMLGGVSVWLVLTWAIRRERRYQANLEQALHDQQRANSQLALLSEVNRRIAASISLDEVLALALEFPRRLIPVQAAALLLNDEGGLIELRSEGIPADELAHWRVQAGVPPAADERIRSYPLSGNTSEVACVLALPLHDGVATIGRIELYLSRSAVLQPDEQALLETIVSEIAEAIAGARRRSREERAIYELERAIGEERARIARDIHDGIAQSLAFMRMRIDLWNEWIQDDPARLRQELTGLKGTLRDQIRELRRAIFALRPIQFDEFGFVGGLQRYIVEFANQHNWDAQVDLSAAPPNLAPELEATCFRIVQEALTNAAKHASASRIWVLIDVADQGLRVRVRDNGIGFDPGQLPDVPGHVGLRQMRERIAAFRGQLTILSQPGNGTEVRVWLPLNRKTP